MGWFTVTILLQLIVPMAFMLLAKMIPLPAAAAARTRIMTLVQDGQMGWVALGYSTTGAYDLYAYISKVGAKAEAWTHPVYTLMLALICTSSFLAAVGALFPSQLKGHSTARLEGVDTPLCSLRWNLDNNPDSWCCLHYGTFGPTAILKMCEGGSIGQRIRNIMRDERRAPVFLVQVGMGALALAVLATLAAIAIQ